MTIHKNIFVLLADIHKRKMTFVLQKIIQVGSLNTD